MTTTVAPVILPTLLTVERTPAYAATIALSATLKVGFLVDGYLARHHHLPALRQTWEDAADRLLAMATDEKGVRVFTRPRGTGLEVAVDGVHATAWLTHPRTFSILRAQLAQQLNVLQPIFVVVSGGTLIAVRSEEDAFRVPKRRMVLRWQRGFPVEITRH